MKFRLLLVLMLSLAVLPIGVAPAQEDAPFTIQAEQLLQEPLTMLYAAMHDGAEPQFVDDGADVLAGAVLDDAVAAFLPEGQLALASDNEAAAAFVDFAVSADGQQVLIDAGLLPDSVTVTDQAGREVTIAQPVRATVSPYGPLAYFFYAVDAQDRLVAVNPLGLRNLQSPGGQAMIRIDPRFEEIHNVDMNTGEINVEEVAALGADLLTTSPRSPYIEAVEELGIPVVLFDAETPAALAEAMLLMGDIYGPNAAFHAEEWIDYYEAVADRVVELTEGLETISVLVTGTEPLRVASGDMYQTAIVEFAGGESVSDELTGFWNDVNLEQIVLWDPDVIVVPSYGGASVEAITESEEWDVIPAAAEGRVYQMPQLAAPLDAPGPDSVVGIVWLATTLYGDEIELDCGAEVEYYYATFYEYDLSAEEVAMMCGE